MNESEMGSSAAAPGPRLRFEIAAGIAMAALFFVALEFLWLTRALVLLTVVGVIFGVTLGSGVTLLERFQFRRSLSAILLVVAAIGVVVAAGWLVAPQIVAQLREVGTRLPLAADRFEELLRNRTIGGVSVTPPDLHSPRALRQFLSVHSAAVSKMLFPFVTNAIAALAGIVVVLFIAIYVATEPRVYRDGLIRLFPPARRRRAGALVDELAAVVRQWVFARFLAMISIGLVAAGVLWAIGVPAPAALGTITGLLEFIPFFGPIVSAVPVIAMAVLVSPIKGLWAMLAFLLIQQLEGNVVTPLIMRNRIAVPPLLTIVSVTALGIVFGVVGMLIAEPMSAVAIVLTRRLYVEPMEARSATMRPAGPQPTP